MLKSVRIPSSDNDGLCTKKKKNITFEHHTRREFGFRISGGRTLNIKFDYCSIEALVWIIIVHQLTRPLACSKEFPIRVKDHCYVKCGVELAFSFPTPQRRSNKCPTLHKILFSNKTIELHLERFFL